MIHALLSCSKKDFCRLDMIQAPTFGAACTAPHHCKLMFGFGARLYVDPRVYSGNTLKDTNLFLSQYQLRQHWLTMHERGSKHKEHALFTLSTGVITASLYDSSHEEINYTLFRLPQRLNIRQWTFRDYEVVILLLSSFRLQVPVLVLSKNINMRFLRG